MAVRECVQASRRSTHRGTLTDLRSGRSQSSQFPGLIALAGLAQIRVFCMSPAAAARSCHCTESAGICSGLARADPRWSSCCAGPRSLGRSSLVPDLTQDLFHEQEPLYADLRAAIRLVTSTCPALLLPLECHSPEGGTRFWIRKMPLDWSPLTESNRRPSPYHGPPDGPCKRRRGSEQAGRWLTLAETSPEQPPRAAFCPPNAPLNDLHPKAAWTGLERLSTHSILSLLACLLPHFRRHDRQRPSSSVYPP